MSVVAVARTVRWVLIDMAVSALARIGAYAWALRLTSYFERGSPHDRSRAIALRGSLYEQRGEFQNASEQYLLASRTGDDPTLLLDAAFTSEMNGDWSVAAELYRRALDAIPDLGHGFKREVEQKIRILKTRHEYGK